VRDHLNGLPRGSKTRAAQGGRAKRYSYSGLFVRLKHRFTFGEA
jgi:hypothetical protein